MDEKDLQMCQILFINSRTPIRDLAEALDISVQGAHRRLKNLERSGVITKFTASISLSYLGAIQYYFSGKSKIQKFDDINEILSKSDRTYRVVYTSGNYVFILALLKEMEDLEPYFKMIKEEVQVDSPQIAVGGRKKFGDADFKLKALGELTIDDYKIIDSLHENSRKTIAEISLEIGASQKTVKKRLERMIENGLIELSINWMPESSTGVTSLTFYKMNEDASISEINNWIRQEYGSRIIMVGGYLDIPSTSILLTWSSTAKEHDEMIDMLNSNEKIEWVKSHITLRQHCFKTWRDDLLKEKAR